jgi:hypothetical protein
MRMDENESPPASEFIKKYLETHKTTLELIAVFIAITTLIVDLNEDHSNEEILLGAICLIFLTGILLIYLICLSYRDIQKLLYKKSDNLNETIQIFFITAFIGCLAVAQLCLISYFFSNYTELSEEVFLIFFWLIFMFFGIWTITAVYTHFTMKKNIIDQIKLVLIIAVIAWGIFVYQIGDFLQTVFINSNLGMILYCIILATLLFGVIHFLIRIPGT